MMTDEISEFLEKIDSKHFNCVYSCNGMTMMRTDEYSNRLEEITELKREVNKYKEHEKYFKNNIKINQTHILSPYRDPLHPEVRKTYVISKNDLEDYIRLIFGIGVEEEVDVIWKDN